MDQRRIAALKAGFLSAATIGLGLEPPAASADRYAGECVLDPGSSCTPTGTPRNYYRVQAWYTGTDEIVVSAVLLQDSGGEWGEARSRSNNSSFVTLDSGCGACSFKPRFYNHGPGRHTVKYQYWW